MSKRNVYARITTRTLVDAARYCYSAGGGSCEGCPLCDIFPGCIEGATRLCDSCRYYTTNKSNY